MKRTAIAIALALLSFLFATVAGGFFGKLTIANPVWMGYYPAEPVTNPPTIIFQSPTEHQTFNSDSVLLNFTILKPDSWFHFTNDVIDIQGNPIYFIYVNITTLSYTIDDSAPMGIPVHDLTYLNDAFPNRSLNFSANLTLPEGKHSLVVNGQGESYYSPGQDNSLSETQINFTSQKADFDVGEQSPFPTTLAVITVSGTCLATVGLGLLVYFKKRRTER